MEDGRWADVLARTGTAGWCPGRDWVRLAVIQSYCARSMRCQARAEVGLAADDLDVAAGALPPGYRRVERRQRRAVLPAQPDAGDVLTGFVWRTARAILREQAGLAELAALLQPGRLTPAELFVVAYIEHLRRVSCDYHLTTALAALRRGIGLEVGARALAGRATDLCRLADPLAPDVPVAAWRAVGRRWGCELAALSELAAAPIVPRTGPGVLPPGTPLRLAHVEAYRRACAWRDARR